MLFTYFKVFPIIQKNRNWNLFMHDILFDMDWLAGMAPDCISKCLLHHACLISLLTSIWLQYNLMCFSLANIYIIIIASQKHLLLLLL